MSNSYQIQTHELKRSQLFNSKFYPRQAKTTQQYICFLPGSFAQPKVLEPILQAALLYVSELLLCQQS